MGKGYLNGAVGLRLHELGHLLLQGVQTTSVGSGVLAGIVELVQGVVQLLGVLGHDLRETKEGNVRIFHQQTDTYSTTGSEQEQRGIVVADVPDRG